MKNIKDDGRKIIIDAEGLWNDEDITLKNNLQRH